MIQMYLSRVKTRQIMFMRIFMITIHVEKEKVFDDMIADIMTNKTLQAIIKILFISCRKLNIHLFLSNSLIFLFQKMSD